MSEPRTSLLVHSSPFLGPSLGTPRLMRDVILSLLPAMAAAAWFFGLAAILVMVAGTAGALLAEWTLLRKKGRSSLGDWSAVLTGIVFALTLPPGLPLWMCLLGGFVSIALGKALFGGLGNNLFNPALVGRAFLQAAFPTAITTWAKNEGPSGFLHLPGGTLALPLMHPTVDVITSATPLGLMKFEHTATPLLSLFVGNTGGSLGETSGALILLGGLFLLVRKAFDWRIPVGILGTVTVLAAALHLHDPSRFPTAAFMLLSGGLLYGTVYMATDPVTSPITPRGAWIFGIGTGALVVLIRLFGGLPEGVMYAILLMNAVTPLINRVTQPKPFGRRTRGAA